MRHPTVRGANIIAILSAGGAVFLLASSIALAEPNTGAQPAPTAEADMNSAGSAPDDFGPVDTRLISMANVAPGVFAWFNDGDVFGLPGTRVGGITERTQLTSDWRGLRTKLARKGVFVDLYNTTAYQQMSGGLDPGGSVINNTQITVNLDTGRLGLWSGGLFHFAAEARAGSDNSKVYGAGTLVPTYYGAVLPQPAKDNDIVFTNYFLEQALGKKVSMTVGIIPGLYFPDRTLFGEDWRRNFGNYAFNQNPIWTQFSNPQVATLTATYSPHEKLTFNLGVYDAKTDPTDFSNFFDEIYVYGQGTYSYEASGLPGQVLVGGLWSNQQQLNLSDPLSVSILPGAPPTSRPGAVNLTGNFTNSSWFLIANFSQYLFVKTAPERRKSLMARGDPLRGIGIFGRAGYAPSEVSAITGHFSLAVLAHGLVDARPDDSVGFGGSYNWLSGDLKNGVRVLSGGAISVQDESAIEVFYNVVITPAISLNTSYQHIWNPFTAALAGGSDSADILMARLSTYW